MFRNVFYCSALYLLGACSSNTAVSADTTKAAQHPTSRSSEAPSPASLPADLGNKVRTANCGGRQLQLRASSQTSSQSLNRTTLHLMDVDGRAIELHTPAELSHYSAVGIACDVSPVDHLPYFTVQYGELPSGCEFCEWYVLYDAHGKQMTRNRQLFLEDTSLPAGQKRYPDNAEFDAGIKRFALPEPRITFL